MSDSANLTASELHHVIKETLLMRFQLAYCAAKTINDKFGGMVYPNNPTGFIVDKFPLNIETLFSLQTIGASTDEPYHFRVHCVFRGALEKIFTGAGISGFDVLINDDDEVFGDMVLVTNVFNFIGCQLKFEGSLTLVDLQALDNAFRRTFLGEPVQVS